MSEKKTYRLGDICKNVCSGGTPKSTNPLYYDGDIPWLNTKEIDFNRISSTQRCITQEGLDNSSAKWIDAYCVIVAMYGATAGKVAINTIPLTTNQACCNLSLDENIADYKYVYYYLCAHYFELASLANGGAQQNLNAQQIKAFEISLPPLSEQKRIAGILGALDDKIELNRCINANLEAQAMALYKHWFVDEQQEDWEYMMLGDIASVMAGGDRPTICSKTETEETRVPIYSNGIDNEGLYGYTNVAIVNEPSVTISARGTIGYVCLRQKPYTPIVRLISAIPKREYVSAVYLYLWAKNMNIMGTGTTQQQLTVPDFKRQKVLIPDSATMQLFNDAVEPVFELIDAYKQENNAIADTRDTLLPKLMNNTLKRYQHENVL